MVYHKILNLVSWTTNEDFVGNSLTVQWLGLGSLSAGDLDSIPGQGTKIP